MDAVGLHPRLELWLIAAREVSQHAESWTPSARYLQAGSGQKIFYDAGSITQDLRLESAFEALGESAPSVDQAHASFRAVASEVSRYAFEAQGDIWHVRNLSTPSFGDPLAGQRWVLFARTSESVTHRIELEGDEVAGALAWLPLLDGHHSADAISAAVSPVSSACKVFEIFNTIGAFLVAPEEPLHLEELPELLFVSHSSVFVRGEHASILIDPAIVTATEALSRAGRRPYELLSHASAVLVSHAHWDHLSFQTMLRIPRTTTIFVPKVTRAALVNPPLRTYLEAFGFERVVEVSDWENVTIGDIELTFVPFFGEPFGLDSHFDAFTYLVRANGKTIYGSLDACHDEAGTMDATFARLGEEHAVDVFLFGSSAQRHEQLFRAANMRHYSNELVRRPDLVRYHPDIDDVIRWCGALRPRAVIPYANFVYFGAGQPDDEAFAAGSNTARYWGQLEGRVILPAAYTTWRKELERLAATVSPPLVMLHPMQGLRF